MKTPELPPEERQRQSALEQIQLLDTPPEERFDRVTRLAARLFDVPIALVSLVDKDRQWFKSCYGLGARETSRDVSFCGHAILGQDTFVVENAVEDERFADNPLVTGEPNIRFYAGAPLEDRSGYRLGTLCLMGRQPRTFSDQDRQHLRDLADMVEREFQFVELGSYYADRTRALNILNEIALDTEGSASERIERALAAACHYLNMDAAVVSDITGETFTVRWHHHRGDGSLYNGLVLPLARTYCSLLLEHGRLLAISHTARSAHRDLPGYRDYGHESYIGIPIWTDGEISGSVNVFSKRPHRPAFTETEKMFVTLLARWVADTAEASRNEQIKQQFISTVSHELRTPLTSIAGSLDLVIGGATGPLGDKTARILGIAQRNTRQLGRLIDDLLDIEKLVSGTVTIDASVQELEAITRTALENIQPLARQRDLELQLQVDSPGLCANVERKRLIQALTNLLSNAIKFSPRQGVVQVSIRQIGNQARIEVTDQGPGVPESFRGRIFQKFAQANGSSSRDQEGTGLGLAITRELMHAMAGEVGFESKEGEGACFWLALPISVSEAVKPAH